MSVEITLTTPALLFPAISLLLVAYTNRFNAISSLIRSLGSTYKNAPSAGLMSQLKCLKKRVHVIRNMQGCGVASLFLCVVCMFALFAGEILLGKIIFAVSLLFMLLSLTYSLQEIFLSVHALNMALSDLEDGDI
ncbi:MAG: DUF2721 domain-containing protein [Gammaproteobacteria bacterium]|nr:DUF2721 domain-containing protein [Gammaproteobacteria bacterium]